ncbi:MAG TPA: MBL fold metallo-hydrolase [Candidatus Methanofastidiosa archaeon]|nr:MBL fold metallo-hydrolase [Candidatus Methanofastidiosa archaeon]
MDISITCLCDNNVKLSSHLRGEHGIAFHIDTGKNKILFDTGQSFSVLSHNAMELGIELENIDKLVLSHGHYDHTGGLDGLLDIASPTIYAHPDIFQEKYKIVSSKEKYIGIPIDRQAIERRADLILQTDSLEVCKGITMTGEVGRVHDCEAVPDQFAHKENGRMVKDDILDDQSLIVTNKGRAMVFLGCNHSGLMNTFDHVRGLTEVPVDTMAGGTHLVAAGEERIGETIEFFKKEDIIIYGFHCTGDKASFKMREGLGGSFKKGYAGISFVR